MAEARREFWQGVAAIISRWPLHLAASVLATGLAQLTLPPPPRFETAATVWLAARPDSRGAGEMPSDAVLSAARREVAAGAWNDAVAERLRAVFPEAPAVAPWSMRAEIDGDRLRLHVTADDRQTAQRAADGWAIAFTEWWNDQVGPPFVAVMLIPAPFPGDPIEAPSRWVHPVALAAALALTLSLVVTGLAVWVGGWAALARRAPIRADSRSGASH